MTRDQAQTATLSGWEVTNVYGDGIIRIANGDYSCFVREDGSCGRVMTLGTIEQETGLRDKGIEVRYP